MICAFDRMAEGHYQKQIYSFFLPDEWY